MRVLLHNGFMPAWAKLSAQERRVVEGLLAQVGEGGITPGMRPHNMRGVDVPLLSLSPNMDLRVIALRRGDDLTVLHVAHHDQAYAWAERHGAAVDSLAALEVTFSDPTGGVVPVAASPTNAFGTALATKLSEAGVPAPLTGLLAECRSEEEVWDHISLIAPEWQELILEIAGGTNESARAPRDIGSNVWVAPSDLALRAALSLPDALWRVFLHPAQRSAVDASTENDLVIVGGPGTGKTVALVHRAVRLAKTCKAGECVVLVGHSPAAVNAMNGMVRTLTGSPLPSLHVVDMVAIGRDGRPQPTDVFAPVSRPGCLRHGGADVKALLIDEAADLHRTTKPFILSQRSTVTTHVTLSVDFNQEVFADNTVTAVPGVISRSTVIHLSYSYRVPREAGAVACRLVASMPPRDEPRIVTELREAGRNLTFGFSAEFVKIFAYDDLATGIRCAERELGSLRGAGHTAPVIFCGTRAQRAAWAEQLTRVGYDPSQDAGLSTPRSVKGLEFDHAVVLAPELLMSGGRADFAMQAIYVALSRVRRGLIVVARGDLAARLQGAGAEIANA